MNWRVNLHPRFGSRWRFAARAALAMGLLLCLPGWGTAPAHAKSKKSKKDPAAAAAAASAAAAEKEEKAFDVPIPINHDAKGVRIPIYNPEGQLQMMFDSEIAFRIDARQLRFTQLKIETYDEAGKQEMAIEMPNSVFNLKTRVLTSTDPVTIRRTDFEVTGANMTFDTQTRVGNFVGPVRMLIYNANNDAEKPQEGAPRE